MNTETCRKQVDFRLCYRVEELAKMTGFSSRFIRDQIKSGDLKAHKLGFNVIVLPRDAEAWLSRQPVMSGFSEPAHHGSDCEELHSEDSIAA